MTTDRHTWLLTALRTQNLALTLMKLDNEIVRTGQQPPGLDALLFETRAVKAQLGIALAAERSRHAGIAGGYR